MTDPRAVSRAARLELMAQRAARLRALRELMTEIPKPGRAGADDDQGDDEPAEHGSRR